MRITVKYLAQIRHAVGISSEQIELDRPSTVAEVLTQLARGREPLRNMLLDVAGALQPGLLLFVGDDQVGVWNQDTLKDGDVLTVLSPMAGGGHELQEITH